jgi:hypothetical protein
VITKLGIFGQKIIDFDGTRHGSVLAKDRGAMARAAALNMPLKQKLRALRK